MVRQYRNISLNINGVDEMKRSYLFVLLVAVLLLAGCIEYKKPAAADNKDKGLDIAKELAEIEKSLNKTPGTSPTGETVKEPVKEEKPSVSETDKAGLQRLEVLETEWVNLQAKVSDQDKDKVEYSFSPPVDKTGKWKTNYGDAGDYIITITASDGKSTTKKNVLLAVKKKNVAPIIEPIPSLTVKEGETISLTPKVSDPNKDQVKVTISKPLESGTWKTDATSAGVYNVEIKATDGEFETKALTQLTVTDVNQAPEIKLSGEKITIKEGEKVAIKPEVSDADGDKVKVTISNPVGDDGEWQTSFTDHGEYDVLVAADDGKGGKATKNVKVVVEDVNIPPEITDVVLVK